MAIPILQVDSVGIRRAERWLFRGLSFQLDAGEVIQVVGENGAGKTSLLRSLCGLLPHAEGEIKWQSGDKRTTLPLFIGHLPAIKKELTVFENLRLHPVGGRFFSEKEIEDAVFEVKLGRYLNISARNLSAGQTRRLGLARLLLGTPYCWVLDEPFTALDKSGCRWLEAKINDYRDAGGCVVMTSHQPVLLRKPPRSIEIIEHAPIRAAL